MSRISYGADIFSPLRSDSSLDDVSISNRESDVFNEFSDNIQKEDKNKNRKRSNVKRSASSSELKSAVKSNDALFCDIEVKSPVRSNSAADNPAFITTRKKSSIDNKSSLVEDSFKVPKPKSNKEKVSITHATKRSESNKKGESKNSRIRQSINPNSTSLPSVAEETVLSQTYDTSGNFRSDLKIKGAEKVKIDKSEVVVNGLNNIDNNNINMKAVLSNTTSISSLNNASDSFIESSEAAKDFFEKKGTSATAKDIYTAPTECFATPREPSASDSTFTESSTYAKIPSPTGSDAPLLSPASEACSEIPTEGYNNSCHPQTMSAGIIEKLIRDNIKFEFDHIRQILYSQQLSTMKYMDKNFIAAKENSSNVDILIKIMQELWEENQQLKRIIAQKCM